MIHDIRYAVRVLLKNPGFTLVAMLVLGLGLGANTAIFSAVKAVLLRPIGMRQPERVVMLWPRNIARNIPIYLVSPALYDDWCTQNHVFSDVAAATDHSYTLTGLGEPESLVSWSMTANFARVLGVDPILGRWFLPEEEQQGKNHEAVLSYQLWQRKFGGDRNVVGKTITLDDAPYTVVGVMPQFEFLNFDLWTPLVIPPAARTARTATFLRVAARLKDGVTLQQAEQDMDALSARLGEQYPETDKGWAPRFQTVRELSSGDVRAPLEAMMGAVGFVLLIVCANLGNLMLARASARRRELAVRVALGASRTALLRQLLAESLLLALAGCALGLLFANWAASALLQIFPRNIANKNIPHLTSIPMDSGVVLFSILLALITGIIFGAMPALQVSSLAPEAELKEGGGRSIGSGAAQRLRSGLVVAQVSLALVLLVCSGLMMKSFLRLQNASLGFNADHLLTLQVSLPRSHYPDDPSRSRFVNETVARLQQMPGVQAAGAVNTLPLTGFWGTMPIQPRDASLPLAQWPTADYKLATSDYFRAMQIPVLRGRSFNEQDTAQSPIVCVVNASFAKHYFPGQDPVGRLVYSDPHVFGKTPFQVVGLIDDVKHFGASEPTHDELYRPFTQDGFPLIAFAVRTAQAPMAMADAARQAIWSVDKELAITRVIPMEDATVESAALPRVSTVIFGFFAITALALAALGIYGVVSYVVTQRTREIGIRMALGARRGRILRMVIGQSLRVALFGLGLGLMEAWAVTRFLSSMLYQVQPMDAMTFAVVPLLLGAVALAAAWAPARRAASVEATVALRHE